MKKDKLTQVYDGSNIKNIDSVFNLLKNGKLEDSNRDIKHFAPANKEWNNSVYTFNKESLSTMTLKDQRAGEAIRGLLNLVPKPIKRTKSRRMRDLLRRTSLKQLFVSKPEIKQNSDKAIITVYTHDREKVTHLRALYMLNRWLNSNVLINKWLGKERRKSHGFLIRRYNIIDLLLENIFGRRRITYRKSRKLIKRGARKYRIKQRFFSDTATSLLNKKQFFRATLLYRFFKWALNFFNIKVSVIPSTISRFEKKKSKDTTVLYGIKKLDIVDLVLSLNKNKRVNKIGKARKRSKIKTKIISVPIAFKKLRLKGTFDIETLNKINVLLFHYLIVNFKLSKSSKENKLISIFKLFIEKYFNPIVRKSIKNEILIIKNLTRLYLNKFKFDFYLPMLKSVLTGIYSKKVQLNLVNLKSINLNSDIFSQAVSIKLRDRTRSLYRVLSKSFGLIANIPNERYLLSEEKINSKVNDIHTYFGRFNVINGNVLNAVFRKMFKDKKRSINKLEGNVKNILSSLKYKKITGIRLEAAGRLTRRYSAARALFKYRYTGPLRNLEHLKNLENKLQSPSLFLLRGNVKPNLQYTFVPYKRRIGAFGIKSWISGS